SATTFRRTSPTSPRFAYTTSFRSQLGEGQVAAQREQGAGAVEREELELDVLGAAQVDAVGAATQRGLGRRQQVPDATTGQLREQDRKSTRLNSSHVKTSYAVFCFN